MKFALVALFAGGLAMGQDWASLNRQAEDFYNKGDLKEAIRIAQSAVVASSNPQQSGHSLDRLGFFEYTAGDLKNGEAHLRQALEIRKTASGPDSSDYAESANDLALLLRDAEHRQDAKDLASQAVAIRSRLLGPKDLRVAESLNTLASIEALLGDYEGGIARFEEARAIHEAQPEPRDLSEEYGTLCVNLAGTYQRVGQYAKAEAMFERGLDVLRVKPGTGHPAYSASLVAYAYLQADLAHYSKAEKLYDEAARLVPQQLGEQHAVYATLLNNRGALYAAIGNVAQAEADYRKALEIKRRIFAPGANTIGAALRNLATLILPRNPDEAGKLLQEAVALYSQNPKPPPFDFASALRGLAEVERSHGDLRAADKTLQRALPVAEKGLGPRHPLRAALLSDLGAVHQAAHEYKEAEARLQEAIAIVTESQGDHHPDLARYLERLASVYVDAGDYASAEPLYRRSLELSNVVLSEVLSIGSQTSKAAVLANLDDPVPALLAFQQKAGDRFPAARTLAFEAVVNRKGRALDQVHDWGQSLRDSSDNRIRTLHSQWEALLECEASFTVALGYRDLKPAVVGSCALPGTDLAGRYERLLHELRTSWTEALGKQALDAVKTIRQRIGTDEAELSRELPRLAPAAKLISKQDVQAALQKDEALIELIAYSSSGKRAYGAYLLVPGLDVQWLDLGPAAALDRSVQDLITSANDWSKSAANNESRGAGAAAETARTALNGISTALRPVSSWLEKQPGVKRLRFDPDGLLNLVPLSAALDARGQPLIRRYSISYVTSGREIAVPDEPAHAAGSLIIALSPGPDAPREPVQLTKAFRTDRLTHLAGAEAEAAEIHKRILKAVVLGEGQATEQRLKQLHHPALLHIVGHGIVRGDADCPGGPASPGCQLGLDPSARAMSLSAIVLEESYGRGGKSDQDGLLTALELQGLDLEGSEMLVLSQCRMADGVPSSGEGVFGMRRAAAIAGVRTFVAPLWNVADSAERSLMSRFYDQLSQGKGRAEALRQAQLQLLASPRTSNFLYWAPVILSGDPGRIETEWFAR